jgi:adenosylmethionine-8-amino-7-oxononanoate aminotransferase
MELVGEVRGRGLLAGIEFVADKEKKTPFLRTQRVQEQVASLAFNRGVIISAGSGGIATGLSGDDIAVAPPFVIERHEIDLLISVLSDCILSVSRELGLH